MSHRLLWQHRIHIILIFCVLIFCVVFHRNSNLGDIISYYCFRGTKRLPLSIQCNIGRLGNQMCTYATLYGLSSLNRRSFIPLSCNLKFLTPYFEELSVKKCVNRHLYIKLNPSEIRSYFTIQDAALPLSSNFIQGYKYPCSYTFFDHVQDEIRQEFRFSNILQQHAHNVLKKANVFQFSNITYVGVHVRRGDYQERWLNAFGGKAVNMDYFQQASKYFRKKYYPLIFIVVSDDRTWCVKNLSKRFDFYVTEEAPTPAHDLAVLASCNHTIITYGTFGFWGAYLAGGEVMYFDKFLEPNTSFTRNNFVFEKMYPPRWKGIDTTNVYVFGNTTDTINKKLLKP